MAQSDVKHVGFPLITNYAPSEYRSHVQNWDFAMDDDGLLYVANTAAVVIYNGISWQLIYVPNSRVFSLAYHHDQRVYVGGLNEIGFVSHREELPVKSDASMHYQSLTHLLPDDLDIGIVWNTHSVGDFVYFVTQSHLMIYDGSTIVVHQAEFTFSNIFQFQESVIIRDGSTNAYIVEHSELIDWDHQSFTEQNSIRDHTTINGTQTYCSMSQCFQFRNNAFEPFKTEVDAYLSQHAIHKIITLSDGTVLFATRRGGIVHINPDGSLIQILDESLGLRSSVIYGIFEDPTGSVWLGTIDGISRVDLGLPIRIFDERSGITEPITRISHLGNQLFVATRSGIYKKTSTINPLNTSF